MRHWNETVHQLNSPTRVSSALLVVSQLCEKKKGTWLDGLLLSGVEGFLRFLLMDMGSNTYYLIVSVE